MTLPQTPQVPFVRTTRAWPEEFPKLRNELSIAMPEHAQAINSRSIGIHDIVNLVTGDTWFGKPTIRKAFVIPAIAAGTSTTIAHGLKFTRFTRLFGAATVDGSPKYRVLPYVDVTNVTTQISLDLDDTNITVSVGATSADLLSGLVELEVIIE